MHSTLPKSYEYNAKVTTMALCILFFGACAAVLGWKAYANDRGLILNGIFTFSENGASIFYWVLTALSLGFVFVGGLAIFQRALNSQSLEITESSVRIPLGFIKKTIKEVEFADVINFSETEVQGQRFFYLHTALKKYCLNRALMPSNETYEEAKALIHSAFSNRNADNSEQDVDPNGCPAASRKPHEHSTINSEVGMRPRSGVE